MDNGCVSYFCEPVYPPEEPEWYRKLTATQKAEHKNWEAEFRAQFASGIFPNAKPDLIEGVASKCHQSFELDEARLSNSYDVPWRDMETNKWVEDE